MIRTLILSIFILFTIKSLSQENAASPYSFYGIGSLKFKGTVESQSMGGLSIYTDSIHVNLQNPAAYGGHNIDLFNNENRPVKYTIGGSHKSITYKNDSEESKASASTVDYFAIAIPINKFGFGFGLIPYTAVGYKLQSTYPDGRLENRFEGKGGVNRVFLGAGYQFTNKLSAGIDIQYNFGNVRNSIVEFAYDNDDNLLTYQTRENNRSDLSGLSVNIGVTYKTLITSKLEFLASATYTPEAQLNSENDRSFSTIFIRGNGIEQAINTTEANLAQMGLDKTKLIIPTKITFGSGIGERLKWFVGAEYAFQKTSNFKNNLYNYSINTTFEDATRISLGGFFIPHYNSYSGYWKRIVYRAGVRFEKIGLNINNQSIKEFGISFGLGLPVGNVFSNANLGFEIGQRGTTKSNLIQENFFKLSLSLSLNDRWFEKRKYN